MSDWLHLIEGLAILGLSTWIGWIQRRGAKVTSIGDDLHEIELRLVKVEVRTDAHAEGLGKLQEALDDVREHMVRREDLEALRRALMT